MKLPLLICFATFLSSAYGFYIDNNQEEYPFLSGLFRFSKRLSDKLAPTDWEKYTPDEIKHLDHGSNQWNLAMFQHLLDLKKAGKQSHDMFAAEGMNGHKRVICKMEPYNECFSIDDFGAMKSLGAQQRPVRLLRIYK